MSHFNKKKILVVITALVLCITMGVLLTACDGCNGDTPPPPVDNVGTFTEGEYSANGTTTGFTSEKGKFYSDYKTLDDAHKAGRDLSVRLAEEGMVLLKNANNALPLTRDERNVTLLGIKSVDIQTGGGGSGNGNVGSSANKGTNDYKIDPTSLEDSMIAAGFRVNQKLLDLYRTNIGKMSYEEHSASSGSSQTLTNELPMSYYNDMITKTYGAYNDAAIITFSRSGAEGLDEIAHKDSHVLQLTDNEKALVKHAKTNFDKVIVLINTGNVMEVGELNAPKTADNLGVDALLYVGHTGNDGAAAIGRILCGEVNPSGHTVDTWMFDLGKDPSYTNFGDMGQNGEGYDNYVYNGDAKTSYHSVEYREDIYVGYRYYETVAADKNAAEADSGETWYAQNVVYPFGYGLSYTHFDWELVSAGKGAIGAANSTITMQVKVTNSGDTTGKDVVQVYAHQPYTPGGIEKAERVLMAYAKTDLLKPGRSQTLTLQFTAQDMASFDWDDANGNDFVGYELEAGNYEIIAARDAHTPVFSVTRTIAENILCKTDLDTGKQIDAVFSKTDGVYADYNTTNESLVTHLISREGGLKQPAASTKADRTVGQAWIDMMKGYETYDPIADDAKNAQWNVKSAPSTWTQAADHSADYSDAEIKIGDMAGVNYQNMTVAGGVITQGSDAGSQKWERFMNQLTWDELCKIAAQGAYGRPSVPSVNVPFQLDIDGPCQIAWYGNRQAGNYYPEEVTADTANGMGTFWVGAVLIASTWNNELSEAQGVMVGNESILTNSPGWYGPACNMHRSALGGRNFEYYSEDPLLAGGIVSSVIRGATSKGVVAYVKHMFLNDQETDRGGICTYATEQAIREIYLKPYEMSIKHGRSLGTMGAGNRIGNREVYNSYALYTGILRNQWDFKGLNISDSFGGRVTMDMDQMLRAGLDCPLSMGMPTAWQTASTPDDLTCGTWDAAAKTVKIGDASSPTQWFIVRQAAMRNLYATANSNGIDNGIITNDLTVEFTGGAVNEYLVKPSSVNCIAFTDMKEVIAQDAASGLPDGVTLGVDGMLSGNLGRAGDYDITISFLADGWVSKTMNVKIAVKDSIAYNGKLSVTAGGAIDGKFSTEIYKVGDTITGTGVVDGSSLGYPGMFVPVSGAVTCTSLKYSQKNLPAGLTLADNGALTGSVAAKGTYTFELTATASGTYMYYGFLPVAVGASFTQTVTLTVI